MDLGKPQHSRPYAGYSRLIPLFGGFSDPISTCHSTSRRLQMSASYGLRPIFVFPELELDSDNSTVAPHFGHMRLDEADGIARVRFRLTAAMGLDGDIEESLVYVLDVNPDGSPMSITKVPRSERNHIQVHYLPARRDPADHITYGANALLGRMVCPGTGGQLVKSYCSHSAAQTPSD